MVKRLPALGLMVACLSAGSAQPAGPAPQEPQPWAEKLFGPQENLVHDFGTVPLGLQLHHDFVLTNTYAVPIEICEIRASSGPLTVWTDKKRLQPNEKASIHVQMDASRFIGQKVNALYVTVSATSISTARLTLKVASREDIVCNPGEVAFGSVGAGETPSANLEIERTGQPGWQISEVVVPEHAPFTATVQKLDPRPNVICYQVKVTLKANAARGPFFERMMVKTNDANAGQFAVVVRGNIQ